jgi:hypothetical protein
MIERSQPASSSPWLLERVNTGSNIDVHNGSTYRESWLF